MSKCLGLLISFFLFSAALTLEAQDRASFSGEAQKVAIVPMSAVKLSGSAVFANSGTNVEEFAKAATDKVVNAFVSLKRFEVLDRTAVETILKEQDFQMSDLVEGADVNLGAFKGADIICIGQLQNVTAVPKYKTQKNKIGEQKSKSKKKTKTTAIYGKSTQVLVGYTAEVEFQIKITDVSTGQILFSKDVKAGMDTFLGMEKYEDSPSKAAFEALNNAEKELKKKLKKLFPVEGKIVEVLKKKDAKFLISIGKSLGVKEDDKLLVIEKITVELEGKKVTREKEIGRLKVYKLTTDGVFCKAKAYKNGDRIVKRLDAGVQLVVISK